MPDNTNQSDIPEISGNQVNIPTTMASELGFQYRCPPVNPEDGSHYLKEGDMVQVISCSSERTSCWDVVRRHLELPFVSRVHNMISKVVDKDSGRTLTLPTDPDKDLGVFLGSSKLLNIAYALRPELQGLFFPNTELVALVKTLEFRVLELLHDEFEFKTHLGVEKISQIRIQWFPSNADEYRYSLMEPFHVLSRRLCKVEDMDNPWNVIPNKPTYDKGLLVDTGAMEEKSPDSDIIL